MVSKLKKFSPFILSIVGTLLSFAVTILLSRNLGKQQYGQIQYWLGISSAFASFSSFGIPNFLIRDGHLYKDKKSFFTQCLFLMLGINLIALPIFFLVSYFAFTELNKNIFLILVIVVSSLSTSIILLLQYQYLLLDKKNLSVSIASIFVKLGLLIVATILLVLNLESVLFQYYMYIYFGVYLIVLLPPLILNFRASKPRFSKAQYLSILIFLLISVCSGTNNQISKIILGEAGRGDYSIVAIYSLVVQVLSVVSALTSIITILSRPRFASLYTQNDIEETIKLYRSNLRLTCRLSIPFFMGFAIQQATIFGIFGPDYGGYPLIMIFMVVAQLSGDIAGPAGTLMAMHHMEKEELLVNVLQFGLFVALSLSFLQFIYFSVPLAIFVSYIVSYSVRAFIIYRKLHFVVIDIKSLIEIVIEVGLSIGVFFALDFVPNIYLKLGLDAAVGLGLIALFNVLPMQIDDVKYFFEKV